MIDLPWKPPQLHADTTWASYCFVIDNRESVLSPYQRLQYFVLQQVKSVASVRKRHWYLVHKLLWLLSPLLPHIQSRALSWVGKQYANKCLGQWNWLWEGINPLNAELCPISHLLALLGGHPILRVSRIRVKWPRIEDRLLYSVLNFVNVKITIYWFITPYIPVENPEIKSNTVGVKYFNKLFNMNAACF